MTVEQLKTDRERVALERERLALERERAQAKARKRQSVCDAVALFIQYGIIIAVGLVFLFIALKK